MDKKVEKFKSDYSNIESHVKLLKKKQLELKNGIKMVLLKYFECHDDGSRSEFFQDGYEAQDAIDDIHDLIGDI